MCGRYYRQSDKQKIAETFYVTKWGPDVHLAPDYNIAPSTFQPITRSSPEDGEREIVLMRWGLVPAKTADPASFKTLSTTNARAETILESPFGRGRFSAAVVWCYSTDFTNRCKGPVFRSRLRSSLVCSGILQLQRNPLQNRRQL
jgi:putative SOS response-associated peptidase YedK